MNLGRLLWTITMALSIIMGGRAAADQFTTGSKSWKMLDGTACRLRFSGFSKDGGQGTFQSGGNPPGLMKLNDFAPEEQEIFGALREGRLKLVTTPGLAMLPEMADGSPDPARSGCWLGEKRQWQHVDGRRLEASLVNLNEDAVALLIGNRSAVIPIQNLSSQDLEYLDRLKRGQARMYPARATIINGCWGEKGTPFHVVVSGERYAALANTVGDFDAALSSVIKLLNERLKSDQWELECFVESEAFPIPALRGFNAPPSVAEKRPVIYQAEISLKKSAVMEARRLWPVSTTPASWEGPPVTAIFVLADGGIVQATRDIPSE